METTEAEHEGGAQAGVVRAPPVSAASSPVTAEWPWLALPGSSPDTG